MGLNKVTEARVGILLSAALAVLVLWWPILLFDLSPYPLTVLLQTAVLREIVRFSFELWLLVVLWLTLSTAFWSRLGGRGEPTRPAWVVMTGSLAVAGLAPFVHGLLEEAEWAPFLGLPILLGFASLAGGVGRALAGLGRPRSLVAAGLALLWVGVLVADVDLGLTDRRLWMAVCGAAVWLGLAMGRLDGGTRPALRTAAAAFVVAVPLLLLLGSEIRGPAEPTRRAPPADAPHVIMVMVDTWRFDHTQLGGYARDTTPYLRALADDPRSTTFSRVWAPATSTTPSIKALFTSRSPSHWGFLTAGKDGPPVQAETLADAFRAGGWRTVAFTANPQVLEPGFTTGFDKFWAAGGFHFLRQTYFGYRLGYGRRYMEAMCFAERRRWHKSIQIFNLESDPAERHRETPAEA